MSKDTAPAKWAAGMEHTIQWEVCPHLCGVHRIPGTDWLVATDGFVAIALVGGAAGEIAPDFLRPVAGWLKTDDMESAGEWPVSALREWVGVAEWPSVGVVECDECGGTGEYEHDCNCEFCIESTDGECDECDGKGKHEGVTEPERRPILFRGQYLNAVLLARVFSVLPDDGSVTLYPNKNPVGMFRGVCGDLRFVVMPLRGDGMETPPQESEPAVEVAA